MLHTVNHPAGVRALRFDADHLVTSAVDNVVRVYSVYSLDIDPPPLHSFMEASRTYNIDMDGTALFIACWADIVDDFIIYGCGSNVKVLERSKIGAARLVSTGTSEVLDVRFLDNTMVTAHADGRLQSFTFEPQTLPPVTTVTPAPEPSEMLWAEHPLVMTTVGEFPGYTTIVQLWDSF